MIPPESVRDQLERIVSSRGFVSSDRLRRFLRFVVDSALDGRQNELKEYTLGVEVFDRRPDYDPRLEPIVRVEARRLRSKLAKYYETEIEARDSNPFAVFKNRRRIFGHFLSI